MNNISRVSGAGRYPKKVIKDDNYLTSVEPPSELMNEDAAIIWSQQSQILIERKVLTIDQLPLLISYCNSFAIMKMADKDILKYGINVDSATGIKKNPSVAVRSAAIAEMKGIGSFFGFDPLSYTRLNFGSNNNKDEGNEFDRF